MKNQFITLAILATTSGMAFAAGSPVANQFSAGQPARAAEVNANFQELADRIDANNASIVDNVSDIATNATEIDTNATAIAANTADISTNASDVDTNATNISANTADIASINADLPGIKQLSVNENLLTRKFVNQTPAVAGECNVRNDALVFDTGAKTFEQTVTIENSSDDVDCDIYSYDWSYSSNLVVQDYQIDRYDGVNLDYAYSMSPGWTLLKDKMRVGESWGSFNTQTVSANGGAASTTAPIFTKQTFLGYQDVTVAAGSYSNCMMIQRERWRSGALDRQDVYFYCGDHGLTRYVDLIKEDDWQLESYTTQ